MADTKYAITVRMSRELAMAITYRAALEDLMPDETVIKILSDELLIDTPAGPRQSPEEFARALPAGTLGETQEAE